MSQQQQATGGLPAVSGAESPRTFAFFLPQYHPIPENDAWWGRGFTEWANVTRARPLFRGHYQPHLPADLGFYDLRVPEVRMAQAQLAREAGISGFAYYHYWFNGRQVLERPVADLLASSTPDLPFFLVWANENWTRAWDGGAHHTLLEQHYSPEDDLAHIRSLRPILADDRYATHAGKPIVAVYRASKLPDARATTDLWRTEAARWGLPGLYLLRIESFADEVLDPFTSGFDAAIDWQPSSRNTPPLLTKSRVRRRLSGFADIAGRQKLSDALSHRITSYSDWVSEAMARPVGDWPSWPCVFVGFDNTARRARDAAVVTGNSPELYEQWLSWALTRSARVKNEFDVDGPPLVFVNAWNEWAEGNHLEPDRLHGRAFLDAHRRAVTGVQDGA